MARFDSDVSSRQALPEPASRATRSHFRVWDVLLIVLVAMAGGGIGLSPGRRQCGPLMGPVEKERGPLVIVVPTSGSAPALSPVLSPSPPPSPSPCPQCGRRRVAAAGRGCEPVRRTARRHAAEHRPGAVWRRRVVGDDLSGKPEHDRTESGRARRRKDTPDSVSSMTVAAVCYASSARACDNLIERMPRLRMLRARGARRLFKLC